MSLAARGFVVGWSGDEDEDVVIDDEEEEQPQPQQPQQPGDVQGEEQGVEIGVLEKADSSCPQPDSPSSSAGGSERETGKRLDARKYRKAFTSGRRMDCPNSAAPSVAGKGKELAVENRRQQDENSAGPSSEKSGSDCDWIHQWVPCSLCKKWRRIPFNAEVERSWQCKDNVWTPEQASCDALQEAAADLLPETVNHRCMDLTKARSSLEEQLDSLPDEENCAPEETGKSADERHGVGDARTSEVDAVQEAGCQSCGGVGGGIISCSGQACNIKYHISCLDPPLTSMPGDAWRCSGCSCAKSSTPALAVESVYKWTSNGETTDEELYYVKWKGRAHIHNTVMSETEVAKLAPKKMSSFKKSILLGKALKWDPLWTEPQRVIAKRTTDAQKIEWLVKWNGLGYEQCSWEAADGGVFATESGELLVARYVRWCETARRFASQPEKKFEKLRSHPDWLKAVHLKQHQFDMLYKLRECWLNRSAGIALCELNKEHIMSVTSFVISLFREFNIRLPVLIITSSEMLHYWDRNLTEWDADLNAVIYRGSGEAREVIQRHEFDYIQGWIKINIVVSTYDIVGSDVDFLKAFRWAAVLVDEAHFTKVGKCFFQNIALLQTDYRLVFSNLGDPCKNNLQDLLQLLSFIDNEEQSLSPCEDDAAQLSEVLERLRRYAVCDCKTEASNNITEFWVPVQMSPVQIHQYCTILSQHYELLRSGSLSQGDMSLHNLVHVLRSCCCHPYLVANALQKSIEEIIPPANYLQIGIRVSGKLELLHKLLLEFHHSKKTVVILVQPRASKLNDILDDYLRQQFGLESYERIQKGMDIQTRQAALQRFNAKDSGRFVLLLERSAAIPDKLKSLDAVFIYGSDWNPAYDTSYLQSLGITSKYVVYRFYSCLSIEEKLLVNARQGVLMDRNLKAVNSKVFQDILQWDAKVLLQIDEWSLENGASKDPRIGWEQVMEELKKTKDDNRWLNRLIFFDAMEVKLLASGVHGYSDKLQAILTPRQPFVEGSPLYGVPTGDFQHVVSDADEFWSALFRDKRGLPQKVRKHNRDQAGGMKPKKRRKSDIPEDKAAEKELDGDQVEAAAVNDLSEQPTSSVPPCSREVETTSSARSQGEDQEERHGDIKPELRSLCDVLQLPAEGVERAEEMLDFVMKNLRMSWNFIHELELALCGIAAEQLQIQFDLSEAIAMSSTKLCFEVEKSDVQTVWAKLKKQLAVSLPHLFNEKDTGISVATKPSEKEIDAALELVKAITRERKTRLLDHQKAEWFRMSRKAEKQKDDMKRVHEVECQMIGALNRSGSKRDRDVFERIKRHEAELKDLERQQKQIMDELRSRQTTCRLDECRLITSHVEQIKAGIMSGPLPELILSEEQPSTVSEVVSQEPEEQVQLQGPGEVVQSERSDVEAEQEEQQHVDEGGENQAHSQHVDQASQVVNQRQETSQHVDQGQTASQVVSRRDETLQHVDQGQTAPQVVYRREETLQHDDQGQTAPQVVSRRQEPVDQGQSSSNINQRQETAQQEDGGRERDTNLQQQQVIQQVNVLPSQSQGASVSGQAHQTRRQLIEGCQQQVVRTGGEGPCIEPQRCTVNQSLDFALPSIQVQRDARVQTQRPVIQVEQTQASTGLEQQPAPLQECQSQSRASGPVRQASASCPLATEELKLLKEIEKSKKVHEDEMSRLAKELEAIKRKYEQQTENERTMYLRKNEVLHHHLQKVGAHRRLAEALRQKDKITSFSRPSPGRNAVVRSTSQPSRPQQQPLTDPSMNFYYDPVSDIASWCPARTAGQYRSEASATPQPVRNSASNTFPGTSTSQLRASPHFPTSEGIPNSSQGIPYTLCRLESIPPFPAIQNQGSQGRENQTHIVERVGQVFGRDTPAGTSLAPTPSQGGPRSDTFRHLPAASQGRVEQPPSQHFRSIPGGDQQQQQFIISPSSDYITLGQVRADPHQQAQFSPLLLAQQLAVSRNHLPVSQLRVSPTSTSSNNGTFNSSQQTPPVVTRELINSMRASSQTMYTSIGQQALVQGQFQQLQTGIHQQNQHHGAALQHQHQHQGGMGAAGVVAQAAVNQQLQQHQIGLGNHQQHQGGGGIGAGVHQQHHHQTGSGGGGGMVQQGAAVSHHLQLQAAAAHYQQHQAGIGAVVHQQQQAGFVHQQQQQQQLLQRTRAVQHPLETPAVFSQNDYICLGDD